MKPKVAFMWAEKAMVRRIRDQVPDVSSALAVYYALCELASDNQSEVFEVTQQAIAAKCGLGVRTIGSRLHDLKGIGAISMEVPPVRSKARFELLDSFGNGCRSIGSKCGTFGNGSSLPLQISNREESRINLMPESGEGEPSEDQQERKPTKPRTPKQRAWDELVDALISVEGGNLLETTEGARGKARKALADIRKACPDVTAEEIAARAARYRRKNPKWTLTSTALANHWGELGHTADASSSMNSVFGRSA